MRSESLASLLDHVDALTRDMCEPQNRLAEVSSRIARNQASGDDFAEHRRLSGHIGGLMDQVADLRTVISQILARSRARAA